MTVTPSERLPPLRDVIRRFDLGARRALGQHFLLDANLCARIVRAANVIRGEHVVEIGPGPGGLTRALLEIGAEVTAVEKDSRCVAALADLEVAYPGKLRVVEADALTADPRALMPLPRRIVANLPYNVATPLLIGWLRHVREDAHSYAGLTLMFQKEVAERLLAEPGMKAYGRLSVMARWLCDVEHAFDISPKAFVPPPKVVSTVVNLTPRPRPRGATVAWEAMERTVAAAFGQRRKMLRQSLKRIGLDPGTRGIDGTRRAETLTVEEFAALAAG